MISSMPSSMPSSAIEFSQEEILRYPRHFSVAAIGTQGQKKIKAARVLLIGSGGIGSPAALYLCASGIGHIGIIDHDVIEASNLQRQVLFRTQDIGKLKVDIAKNQLNQLNPYSQIHTYPFPLSPENATEILAQYDYILDGSDNYPTRYLVNQASQATKKILISASVFQFGGQVVCFSPEKGPCYECLYPSAPPPELIPNCTQNGVLGVIPGVLSLLAVNQIFMHILDLHSASFFGRIHEFNGIDLSLKSYDIPINPGCQSCGCNNPNANLNLMDTMSFCKASQKYPSSCEQKNQANLSPIQNSEASEISATALFSYIHSPTHQAIQIIDVREPWEREISKIEPSTLIPLGNLISHLNHSEKKLDPKILAVTYCQVGIRSAKAAQILRQQGFENVKNLSGGIESWLAEIKTKTAKIHPEAFLNTNTSRQ